MAISSSSSSSVLKSIGLYREPDVGAGRLQSMPSPTRLDLCGKLLSRDDSFREEGPTEGVVERVEMLRRSRFVGRLLMSLDPDLCTILSAVRDAGCLC